MSDFVQALSGKPPPRRLTTPLPSMPPRGTCTVRPFKFPHGQASDLKELAVLCDEAAGEATSYLTDGVLENWLAANGEAVLASRARQLAARHHDSTQVEKRRTLELLVRDLRREAGLPFELLVEPEESFLDAGAVPLGAQIVKHLTIRARDGRYAWGTVELCPPVPGVTVSPIFDTHHEQELKVEVCGATCPIGQHHASIVIAPEGAPAVTRVPFEVTVQPLDLTVAPASLDFGEVGLATRHEKCIQISGEPRDGILTGQVEACPPCSGHPSPPAASPCAQASPGHELSTASTPSAPVGSVSPSDTITPAGSSDQSPEPETMPADARDGKVTMTVVLPPILANAPSSGVTLAMDGMLVGLNLRSPSRFRVPPGRHFLKFTKPGFKPCHALVDVSLKKPCVVKPGFVRDK